MGLLDGFFSLAKDLNKVGVSDDASVDTLLPELELSMEDDELIDLAKAWTNEWAPHESGLEKMRAENELYWLGKQFEQSTNRPASDNLIFESLETFLPIATRPKADPLVESDNTNEGNALADKVRKMLVFVADNLSYNLQLKQVTRFWALYMLGVMKVGWSMKENDITCIAVRPQKLILDPNAYIDAKGEYTGYYIGEWLDDNARDLITRFPKKEKYISDKVKGKLGTKVKYILWTTDDYVFWTLDDTVLAKSKNPHWNYDTEEVVEGPMDAYGNMTQSKQKIPGKNHFKNRKKPYIFLSIFNLGKHPHDETNLIQQNLGLQDLINKRLVQVDKNADNANGGLIVSGDAFTEEQAQKAGKALRNGGAIWVPSGDVNSAVKRDSGTPLPNFVYESLIDYRNELRNIFGTRGSTPQGTIGEDTVGGKQIIKGQDTDRIGGGVSSYLEQFSDQTYNWFVQLMYVYYDEPRTASVLGPERAKETISLMNSEFTSKLLIGVKEGSMIPHDPASQRGEAMALWTSNGIDPITFFDRLEFPNPRESAKNLYLWMSDPVALFPELAVQQQQAQLLAMDMEQQKRDQEQQGTSQQAEQAQQHQLQQIALKSSLAPKPTVK